MNTIFVNRTIVPRTHRAVPDGGCIPDLDVPMDDLLGALNRLSNQNTARLQAAGLLPKTKKQKAQS